MIRAAIFDLDGTILDTLDDLMDATNRCLVKHGFPMLTKEQTRLNIGDGIMELIRRSVPKGTDEETIQEMFQVFLVDYKANCNVKTKVYDGVLEMLQNLKNHGILLGVVSNKYDAGVQELISCYYPGLFDYIAGVVKGVPMKPEPDMILAALRGLQVNADEALYFGDADTDLYAATAAGVRCINVSWGFRTVDFLLEHGATTIIDRVEEINERVLKG